MVLMPMQREMLAKVSEKRTSDGCVSSGFVRAVVTW
jgi:hypothetical protein